MIKVPLLWVIFQSRITVRDPLTLSCALPVAWDCFYRGGSLAGPLMQPARLALGWFITLGSVHKHSSFACWTNSLAFMCHDNETVGSRWAWVRCGAVQVSLWYPSGAGLSSAAAACGWPPLRGCAALPGACPAAAGRPGVVS